MDGIFSIIAKILEIVVLSFFAAIAAGIIAFGVVAMLNMASDLLTDDDDW